MLAGAVRLGGQENETGHLYLLVHQTDWRQDGPGHDLAGHPKPPLQSARVPDAQTTQPKDSVEVAATANRRSRLDYQNRAAPLLAPFGPADSSLGTPLAHQRLEISRSF